MTSAKKSSYFSEAIGLLGSTLPILGINVAIYAGFFFVALLWFGFWAGLAFILGKFIEFAWVICYIIAIGAGGFAWRMARRYLLYIVKGAHIAAMTEMMCGRPVPKGIGQVAYGRDIIKSYFKDVSILFVLSGLIEGAVRGLTGMVMNITRLIPLPGNFRKALNFIRMIILRSLSYVDEAILSAAIARQEKNVWKSAVDSIVLYGQSYRSILLTTLKIWAIGKAVVAVAFIGFLAPALLVAAMLENNVVAFFGLVAAVIGARLVELALYEPFALAYTMVTFHRETQGKQPDAAMKARLEGVSAKFRELIGKADEFERESHAQPAQQATLPQSGVGF